MYKSYPLLVFGFHGCERSVAEKVLSGEAELQPSDNPYDWLGTGIYFWENAPERALLWAKEQKKKAPYVIGAVIQLSNCFNLMDKGSAEDLMFVYNVMLEKKKLNDLSLPKNKGKLHILDKLIINATVDFAEEQGYTYDAVRGAFIEGEEVFPGSSLRADTHIQLCVRKPECILAYFRPKMV